MHGNKEETPQSSQNNQTNTMQRNTKAARKAWKLNGGNALHVTTYTTVVVKRSQFAKSKGQVCIQRIHFLHLIRINAMEFNKNKWFVCCGLSSTAKIG